MGLKKNIIPFSELEAQEISKVDQLIVKAKSEYVSKKVQKVILSLNIQLYQIN